MREIELSAGTIEYEDAGDGPAVVLSRGMMMDSSLWDALIADLSVDHRCVAPVLHDPTFRRRPATWRRRSSRCHRQPTAYRRSRTWSARPAGVPRQTRRGVELGCAL
jgi:hypothetical protein